MGIRNDIPDITVLITDFQDFDHGEETRVRIPKEFNPHLGDVINWECAQFQGTAEIINCDGEKCTIKKKSQSFFWDLQQKTAEWRFLLAQNIVSTIKYSSKY